MTQKNSKKKSRFLRELEKNPIVERACKVVKVSRSTYYRWRNEDENFFNASLKSVELGREKFNDFAESKLLENIQANQHPAITYWLSNNSKQYRRPTTVLYTRENEQLAQTLRSQLELIDFLVAHIGMDKVHKLISTDPHNTLAGKVRHDKRVNKDKKKY